MAKSFDFNALQLPALEVTLPDAKRTRLHVTTPTEGLYERFLAMQSEVEALTSDPPVTAVRKAYDIYAQVLSNNEEGLTFTAESLRDEYKLTIAHLICFTPAYLAFLEEIKNAKN